MGTVKFNESDDDMLDMIHKTSRVLTVIISSDRAFKTQYTLYGNTIKSCSEHQLYVGLQ